MAAKNDVTGDAIKSKETNQKYRDNYDRIFKKKRVKTKRPRSSAGLEQGISTPKVAGSSPAEATNSQTSS